MYFQNTRSNSLYKSIQDILISFRDEKIYKIPSVGTILTELYHENIFNIYRIKKKNIFNPTIEFNFYFVTVSSLVFRRVCNGNCLTPKYSNKKYIDNYIF